jgi:D-alanyl-D-alanine carboxypeptidase (penicillin-binding protein 5/6)
LAVIVGRGEIGTATAATMGHMRAPSRRLTVALGLAGALTVIGVLAPSASAAPNVAADSGWPSTGQAAYALGPGGTIRASAGEHEAPIASVAKVMTAYLVLRMRPIAPHTGGFPIRITERDVQDTDRRIALGESYVPVRLGERLTERQALAAVLLPSANNIAAVLASRVAGSAHAFIASMNRTARAFGMRHTVYTDPSGFTATTRSTAADQVRLAKKAMRESVFRALVGRAHYAIPVAGTILNTDRLLGSDGFVGIKTGSMSASGGCFMFLSERRIHGRTVPMYGVVLGQPGEDLIGAGLAAAQRLVDAVAPTPAA